MNKAITGKDIGAHPNLVLHLKLDAIEEPDNSHSNARVLDALDSSKPAASVHGRPKVVADERFGSCLQLTNSAESVNQYLTLPLKALNLSKGYTFSCWVHINSDSVVILDTSDLLLYVQGGELICRFDEHTKRSACYPEQNKWMQIAITIHEDGVEFFVDVPFAPPEKKTWPSIELINESDWRLGHYADGWEFNGKIAQLRFYDAPLDFEAIKQQWLQDQAKSLPQSFTETAPIDFEFWDEEHQPIIYTQGGEVSHKLSVALWNKDISKRELAFAEPEDFKGESQEALLQYIRHNHHIELRFPRETLSNKSIELLLHSFLRRAAHAGANEKEDETTGQTAPTHTKEDWIAFYQNHPELNAESIYLISPIDQTLAASDDSGNPVVMEIVLPHLCVQSGAYSVPVELRPGPLLSYKSFSLRDRPSNLGKRIRNLQIQTQKGHKAIPLHFGVVGSNTVINDGTQSKLLLRLTNIDAVTTIKIKDSGNMQSQLILSCDLSKHGGHQEWALTDEAAKVTVEVSKPGILQPDCQMDNHWQSDPVEPTPSGNKVEWIINGSRLDIDHLAPNESVYFRLTVETNMATGPSDLHMHYRHIEGYWDGNRSWTLEKSPLVFHRAAGRASISKSISHEDFLWGDIKLNDFAVLEVSTSDEPSDAFKALANSCRRELEFNQVNTRERSTLKSWADYFKITNPPDKFIAFYSLYNKDGVIKETSFAINTTSSPDTLNQLIPHITQQLGLNPLVKEHIGIGTTNPASMLTISEGLTIGTTWADKYQAPSGGLLLEGSVGIGTHHPNATLDVKQSGEQHSALFKAGAGVRILGVKGANNALLLNENETDYASIRVTNKGRGGAIYASVQDKNSEGYAAIFDGGQGVKIRSVRGASSSLEITAQNTGEDKPALSVTSTGASGALYAGVKGPYFKGHSAQFEGGWGVSIKGIKSANAIRIQDNTIDHAAIYVNNDGSGKAAEFVGDVEVAGCLSNGNVRKQIQPELYPLKKDGGKHDLFKGLNFELKCWADVLFLVEFNKVTVQHDSEVEIFLRLYQNTNPVEYLTSIEFSSAQYNSKDKLILSESMHFLKTEMRSGAHFVDCAAKCKGTYLSTIAGCTLTVIQL